MDAEQRARVLAGLISLAGERDIEHAHAEADELLLQLIDDQAIRDAYDAIDKWYA